MIRSSENQTNGVEGRTPIPLIRLRCLQSSENCRRNKMKQNKMAERFASVSEDELCEKCIIKQLLNSVFA